MIYLFYHMLNNNPKGNAYMLVCSEMSYLHNFVCDLKLTPFIIMYFK